MVARPNLARDGYVTARRTPRTAFLRFQSGPFKQNPAENEIKSRLSSVAARSIRAEYRRGGRTAGSALGPVATERAAAKETRVAAPAAI